MKVLAVLAVLASALAVATGASAATGTATQSMMMGSVTINAAGGSTFSVSTQPFIYEQAYNGTEVPQQDVWNAALWTAQNSYPNQPLDVYTVACWIVFTPVAMSGAHWDCALADSGPATTLDAALAQRATTTINTTTQQVCPWIAPYDATTGQCDNIPGNAVSGGVDSPAAPGNMIPNLDAWVGKTVTFDVWTNWASFIAPPGFDVLHHIGMGWPIMPMLGMANQEYALSVGIGADRMLSAAGSSPLQSVVKMKVGASSFDCHVPRVKGLTVRRARQVLRAAHCGVARVYRTSRRATRVRYQPLKVGTGRPRGYRVTLVAVK